MVAAKKKPEKSEKPDARKPVYVVFGRDGYLRDETLKKLLGRLIGEHSPETVLAEFDGDNASLANVLDEVRSFSLLAPLRVACVRDADDFVSKNRDALERYVKAPCDSGVLVLACAGWPKTTRLYKMVEALGGNVDCNPPDKPWEFVQWVVDRVASEFGCRVTTPCAKNLVDLVGDDTGRIQMELAKLSTFVWPRKEIREEDVEELVAATRADKVFKVTDSIASRDVNRALEVWDQLLATDRAAPYMAVGGLASAFRRLAEAKRLILRGTAPATAAREAGMFINPEELQRQLRRFSLRQWQDALVKLLRIDVGSKRGKTTIPIGVEKFIVELCSAK